MCSYPSNCLLEQLELPPTRWDLTCSRPQITCDPVMHSFGHSSDWHNAMKAAVANWNTAVGYVFFKETGGGPYQTKGLDRATFVGRFRQDISVYIRNKWDLSVSLEPGPCVWFEFVRMKMYINLDWTWVNWDSGCTYSADARKATAVSTLTHEFGHWLGFVDVNRYDRSVTVMRRPGCRRTLGATDPQAVQCLYHDWLYKKLPSCP